MLTGQRGHHGSIVNQARTLHLESYKVVTALLPSQHLLKGQEVGAR